MITGLEEEISKSLGEGFSSLPCPCNWFPFWAEQTVMGISVSWFNGGALLESYPAGAKADDL